MVSHRRRCLSRPPFQVVYSRSAHLGFLIWGPRFLETTTQVHWLACISRGRVQAPNVTFRFLVPETILGATHPVALGSSFRASVLRCWGSCSGSAHLEPDLDPLGSMRCTGALATSTLRATGSQLSLQPFLEQEGSCVGSGLIEGKLRAPVLELPTVLSQIPKTVIICYSITCLTCTSR